MCSKYDKLQILYRHVNSDPISKSFTIQYNLKEGKMTAIIRQKITKKRSFCDQILVNSIRLL